MTTCIYCKTDSSNSKQIAHIVSTSFGENNTYLPIGAECDGCNNYASTLEKSFLHHNRIRMPILMRGIKGRVGKRRSNLGGNFRVDNKKETFHFQFREDQMVVENGETKIYLPTPREFNDVNFRRCLYHIAFNYVCWKFGQQEALDKRFDSVRKYVRKPKPKESWMYAQVSYPDDLIRKRLEILWVKDSPGLIIKFESFIDDFYMDLYQNSGFQVWVQEHLGGSALLHSSC